MEEKYLQMNINYTILHNIAQRLQVSLYQQNVFIMYCAKMLEYRNNKMLPKRAIYKIQGHPIYTYSGICLEMENTISSKFY